MIDVLLQICDYHFHRNLASSFVPDVIVRNARQRGVADFCLPRQLGFRYRGHADHVHAPTPVDFRLGLCRELRAFDADVGAAAVHRDAERCARWEKRAAEHRTERLGKADVGDDAVAEEGVDASFRVIVELIRHQNVLRRQLFTQGAARGNRDEKLNAKALEAIDVRAGIEVAGLDVVSPAMPGQEC